jgi:hypothetical protein
MKKISWIFALLAALTVVFVGCTEGDASLSITDFNAFPGSGYVSAASVSTVTDNGGPCATLSGGIFTINPTANYQSAISFQFPQGLPKGATKLVIDYYTDGLTKSKWTPKTGFNGKGDPSPSPIYNQVFKAGQAQYEFATSAFGSDTGGFTIEMAEVADNAPFRIIILNVEFQ